MSDPAANGEGDSSRTTCPSCGSSDVVPIVYGEPTQEWWQELWEQAKSGTVELGGRLAYEGMPTRKCKACGHSWPGTREAVDEDE